MKLILLVGPPGSGKSTLAKEYVELGYTYINQDKQGKGHLALFLTAVGNREFIVVDRMGFSVEQRKRYLNPAKEAGYETEIIVLHQPYQVCLERIRARQDHETIKTEDHCRSALATFFGKYERVQDEEADKVTRIWPEGFKPSACIIDLDGTLCNVEHRLHHVRAEKGKRDWKSFFSNILGDSANEWCAEIVRSLSKQQKNGPSHVIIYCSGRPDSYRKETIQWLEKNNLHDLNSSLPENGKEMVLFMRPRNDSRDDSIVKEIILDFEILSRYTPFFAIDDRARVFEMWRKRGIVTLACAKGDF